MNKANSLIKDHVAIEGLHKRYNYYKDY